MYGLIGKTLGHSFSANFFNEKFKKEGIDETYKLLPIPSIEAFPDLLKNYPDLKGLNVTIPYKQQIISYLDSLSPEASEVGAVNVIRFMRENERIWLEGHNSDVIGFHESLKPLLRPNIKKALILGTGGASKAVAYVLKSLGIEFMLVSRSPKDNEISYDNLGEKLLQESLLIVNTTPLGTYPDIDTSPPIPYQYLTENHICYDLVYNPEETLFLKRAARQGAKIKNGLEMLHLQAVASWDIWNQGDNNSF